MPAVHINRVLLSVITSVMCLLSAPGALAGNGTFHQGAFNFCVSVRFNANATQLAQVRAALQSGSNVLLDATDGQHRFGRVTIVNDSGASQSAEYWVNQGAGRAYATFGRYGFRGEHVNMYFDSDFQGLNGSLGDAYRIAHEHVHHAYGVADEYNGPSGPAEDAPTPDTATLNYSLMDNFFLRGGMAFGTGYTLNELCVASNHDPDGDTYQEQRNGESVWETLASQSRFPVTMPAGLPVSAAPSSQPVTFVDGVGGLRVVLLLDRSGSMVIDNRLALVKLGARQFVTLVRDGDGIGVTSFDQSSYLNFPLTEASSAVREAARAAIDALTLGGATNIGGGLVTALGQLTSQSSRSCNEIIVLLSDGDHNYGTAPSAAIPALQAAGVTVLTVGVGSGISTAGQAALQSVASATGGRYFSIANAGDVTSLFIRLAAETSGSGILARAPESIATGEVREIEVPVERGVEAASFSLTRSLSTDPINFSLRDPAGAIVTTSNAASFGIDVVVEQTSVIFQVPAPEPGVWTMIATAGAPVVDGQVELLAFASHDGVQLNVSVDDDVLEFPQSVRLVASPLFSGESVVGASVTGTVTRPDGSRRQVVLRDDGQGVDTVADDGVYTADFSQYNEDGTYTFDVTSRATGARTYAGEDLFIDSGAPSSQRAVPDFVRIGSATAVVSGVPDFVPATIEYGPETINLKSRGLWVTAYVELPSGYQPVDVALNTLAVTAIDGVPITPLAVLTEPNAIGDFDNDGIPDLMVKIDRGRLQSVLTPGMRNIRMEGLLGTGESITGERSVAVIRPGK